MPGGSSARQAHHFPIVTWWFGTTLGACHAPPTGVPLPRAAPASGDALLTAHMRCLTARIYVLPYAATTFVQGLILPSIPNTYPEARRCLFAPRAAVILLSVMLQRKLKASKQDLCLESHLVMKWRSSAAFYN